MAVGSPDRGEGGLIVSRYCTRSRALTSNLQMREAHRSARRSPHESAAIGSMTALPMPRKFDYPN